MEKQNHTSLQQRKKRVIIVGAGFGGLNAAKKLGNRADIEVLLFDQRNYHLFQPLLYQVATAGLSPADIAVPIRSELHKYSNIEVHMGRASHVNTRSKTVQVGSVLISYDFLILACGAQHSYFGKNSWEEFAPGLKTLEQATEIRRRILLAFELAENELDPIRQQQYLTFVVVGAGPTGVELAGALGEISRNVLIKDFHRIDPSKTKIILLEAGDRILPSFSSTLSNRAFHDLNELGVDILVNTRVTGLDELGVEIGHRRISAKTVIWAAGVQASNLAHSLQTELDHAGRVIVQGDLTLQNAAEVFVIGDMAHCKDRSGQPLPGLAAVAIQQGRYAAKNILEQLKNKKSSPFHYRDKGLMATIGKHKAVVEKDRLKFGGWGAWLAWLGVHIYYLAGFRNRIVVLAQWAWSYIFSRRSARLIMNKKWQSYQNVSTPDNTKKGKSPPPLLNSPN